MENLKIGMIRLHIVVHEFVVLFSTFPVNSPIVHLIVLSEFSLSRLIFTSSSAVCETLCPCIVTMLTGVCHA